MKKALLFILLLVNVYSVSAYTKMGHYRWRNNDGNEKTATWKGATDAPLKMSIHDIPPFNNALTWAENNANSIARKIGLRIYIEAGSDITVNTTLQYSKDNGINWITITDDYTTTNDFLLDYPEGYTRIFDYYANPMTERVETTQQISTTTSFVTGRVVSTPIISNISIAPVYLTAGLSTELEYYILPTSHIESSQTYIFRTINSSSLTGVQQVPTLITGDCYTTIPSAPSANAEQTFCFGTNPSIANLAVADTNIVWYDAAAGGNELPTSTPLVDGNVYYCQKFSYCTVEIPRTAVTARIPDNSITTNASICNGDSYTWLVNGVTYTTSGNYTFVKDCHTENLNLTVNTIPVPNAIDNQIFNNNQVTQPIVANKICAIANEGQNIQLTAPTGFLFTGVPFASFGTPNGSCDNFTLGSCHATNSIATVEGLVLGQNSATIPATNDVFGDPCGGTPKRLYVEAAYGTVRWTNNTPSIGLPASGTGTLPSFTAVNSSCSPIVATITVIFNNGFCDSAPKTFTITVNPNTIQTTTTTVCDSYTWPANGIVYTTSGTYSIGTNCNTKILNLTVNKTAPPTGIINQISTSAITLADLMVTGTNVKWYDAAVAGSELPNNTIVIDNISYYATQTLFGCESTIRQAFTTNKISEATQTVCLNATVNDLITTPSAGKTAKWYNTTSEGNTSLTGTTIVSNGTYYLQQHEPITPIISSLAGNGNSGNIDGIGTIARFNSIYHLAVDSAGNIYAADINNNSIRKITPAGVVSTFAGSTQGFADGTGTAAQFNRPSGIAIDSFDNLYVADTYNNKIRKITPEGVVSTLAGSTQGDADGIGTAAQFYLPIGIAVDGVGNLFITDLLNYKIKKMTPDGMVSTLAGTGFAGNMDGLGTIAQFNAPVGIAVDAAGTLYVTETINGQIRKITPTGTVSTLAGNGVRGFADGSGTAAQFSSPIGIIVDATGNLYVGDVNNSKIRKITPTGEASTFAGSAYGYTDGPLASALFVQPRGIAIDDAGNIYVSDNNKIRKIAQNAQSNRLAVTVIVNDTPAPTASAQSYCGAATVADLAANGTTLQWYDVAIGGAALESTANLSTGTYYVSQTVGCESPRIAVAVTITPSSDNVTTVSDCDSYTWNGTTYTTSGIKTGLTTNCVTEKLDLTITASPIATVSLISIAGDLTKLSADQMGASYQWIDCNNANTPIFGETNQSFTPTVLGTYSVIVTSGTCSVTSDCIVVSSLKTDNFDINAFNFYPNPVKDNLNLSYSKEITSVKVFNMIGQTLLEKVTNATTAQINMSAFSSGTYFVEVKSLDSYKTIKVIKK